MLALQTVYSTVALNEAHGVPRKIVRDDVSALL